MAQPGKLMKIARSRAVKGIILLTLAGIAICLAEFTPKIFSIRPEQIEKIVSEAGLLGPTLLVVLSALGTTLFIPGTVFVGAGTAIFGPYLGFMYVWPGITAGAVISWLAARMLGREFVYSIIGDRLGKYDELIERNGFKAVLLLRLLFLPLVAINYGAGLTRVRFRDYFFATALGEAVTILAITFLIGQIREFWISGDLSRLISTRMILCAGFLIAVAFAAKAIKKKYLNSPGEDLCKSLPQAADPSSPEIS